MTTVVIGKAVVPARGAIKAQVSIQQLLIWAFQSERASIDFGDDLDEAPPAYGVEYVIHQQGLLGCKVDGGGRSSSHPDADLVADALAVLPDVRGGRRMALLIAELARAGRTPDVMADAVPYVAPREMAHNQFGQYAVTESGTFTAGGKAHNVRYCPIRYPVTAPMIGRARRAYLEWWGALLELRHTFHAYSNLSAFEVSNEMPRQRPWQKKR
ncbi:hypothetical protein [Candidatus Halocynthiibacter alkanivorans]|uniref:hypothetical protein n=1 Tax=Candidatus Halocynthiibacter alkanivorans TaxID=2267619 RepID=UPI00109D6C70|nr:hypothetical protein [Candidatus Halocynthiibacter alkanivorans]